jgi:hypothetical protein
MAGIERATWPTSREALVVDREGQLAGMGHLSQIERASWMAWVTCRS